MTIITSNSLRNLGQERAKDSLARVAATRLAMKYTDGSDGQIIAMMSAVIRGQWVSQDVVADLVDHGITDSVKDIFRAFRQSGIIEPSGQDFRFSSRFSRDMVDDVFEIMENAPARFFPLTEKPQPWSGADQFNHTLNVPLVKSPYRMNPEEYAPKVYQAINKLQNVAYEINPALVSYFDRMDISDMAPANQRRIVTQQALLKTLATADELYFYCTMDYRGRIYYRGGILTPQGTDFEKAAFRFREARPLGKNGLAALYVHFANLNGMDKDSIVSRIAWGRSNAYVTAMKIMDGTLVLGKKEKFQGLVAAAEIVRIYKLMELGANPETLKSQLVLHQDGTCNGLQHGAAITGDLGTAKAVNCTTASYSDSPEDIYGMAAETLLQECSVAGLQATTAFLERLGGGKRGSMKNAVMVTSYGAGLKVVVGIDEDDTANLTGFAKYVREEAGDLAESVLTELRNHLDVFTKCMENTLTVHAGAIIAFTQRIREMIKHLAKSEIYWQTADGFMVAQAVGNKSRDDRSYAGTGGFTVRTDKDEINESNQLTGISPNFIHSIDATHLRGVVRTCDWELCTVHDSIGSHAGTFWDTAKIIRSEFVATHEYDQLGSLAGLNGLEKQNFRTGTYDFREVRKAMYLFS